MIEVRLFASLREGREKVYTLAPDTARTAIDIAQALELPLEDIAIILINGRHARPESALSDGDILSLFPAVGGG